MIQFKLNKQIVQFILVVLTIFMVYKILQYSEGFFITKTTQKTKPLIYSIVLLNTEEGLDNGYSFLLTQLSWDKVFGSEPHSSDIEKSQVSMSVKVNVNGVEGPVGLDVESILVDGKIMIKATRSNHFTTWKHRDIITKWRGDGEQTNVEDTKSTPNKNDAEQVEIS
jgi:hypothetical protein